MPTKITAGAAQQVVLVDGSEVTLAAGSEVTLAAGSEVSLTAGTEVSLAAGSEVGVTSLPSVSFIDPSLIIMDYLLNGGSNDMTVNGSVTPVPFSYTPPVGFDAGIARMILYMESSTNFSSTDFMNIAALVNGISIVVNGVTLPATWKDNIDIVESMFDLGNAGTAFSNVQRSLAGRMTFSRMTGGPLLLVEDGASFVVNVNDDLTATTIYRTTIQGILRAI